MVLHQEVPLPIVGVRWFDVAKRRRTCHELFPNLVFDSPPLLLVAGEISVKSRAWSPLCLSMATEPRSAGILLTISSVKTPPPPQVPNGVHKLRNLADADQLFALSVGTHYAENKSTVDLVKVAVTCLGWATPVAERQNAAVSDSTLREWIVLVRVGHFARGPVIVIAEVLGMGADTVRHLEGVQRRIGGEEAAVVGGDIQTGVAFVNGAEQAAEVEPDGAGVVWVAVLEGALEGFGGEQAAVFAKGAE